MREFHESEDALRLQDGPKQCENSLETPKANTIQGVPMEIFRLSRIQRAPPP